jgi:tetratricopeptide (TPR) repeat protein
MQSQLLDILVELELLENDLMLPPTVALLTAWTLVYKVAFWIAKADKKESDIAPLTCLDTAVVDINKALDYLSLITESDDEWSLSRKCTSLLMLKWTHVKIQSTAVNYTKISDEEMVEIAEKIATAREAEPGNEQIEMIYAKALNCAGRFDEAVVCCENALALAKINGPCTDCSLLVAMLCAKILLCGMKMGQAQQTRSSDAMVAVNESLKDVDAVFEEAIEIEPNSVEALFRYAHFKSIMGDYQTAKETSSKALGQARSKGEIEKVLKLTIKSSAQVDAIAFISSF